MVPVFIGGCSRSGTTMLGAMLGSHTDCLVTPESQFFIEVFRSTRARNGQVLLPKAMRRIQDHWRLKVWNLGPHWLPAGLRSEASSPQQLVWHIVETYGKQVGKPCFTYWIDHTPTNMEHAATFIDLFPDCKFIHMIRDGRAIAASVSKLDWGRRNIPEIAHWWVEKVGYGLAAEIFLDEEKILRVQYENLVRAPERSLEIICRFIGISYEQDMVGGHGFRIPDYTWKQHTLLGTGPDPGRTTAWKAELSKRQIEIFESLTGDFLRHLGYTLEYGGTARRPSKGEAFAFVLQNVLWHWPKDRLLRFYRRRRWEKEVCSRPI